MENTRPVFFYNFKDSDETFLKLNRDNYNEILLDSMNKRQIDLLNKRTDYTRKTFGNGVSSTNEGSVGFDLVQCADEYFAMSTDPLSAAALKVVKDKIAEHIKNNPNENSTPKKEHTDTPVIGGNGLEAVGEFSKPAPFYLYNKEKHCLMEINIINGEFNFNDVPDDLKGFLKDITPNSLENQQNTQNSNGKPFMNIGDHDQYFLIHPKFKENYPDKISEKAFREMMFLEKTGRTEFPKATKPTNSDRSRVNNLEKSHSL